jgi:hypothetical protein
VTDAAILTRLAGLEQKYRDQAEVIAGLGGLSDQIETLDKLVSDLVVKAKREKPGRMPRPTPKWHKLTAEELDAERHKLRGYEQEIFPMLGHLVHVRDCWPYHPLACIVIEILGELYQCLFMTKRRPPALLNAQADFFIRVAPGLLALVHKELHDCIMHNKVTR